MENTADKAVALDFDLKDATVPTVLATGEGAFARQILEVAFANGVKVREDADLVEILSTLEVGDEIPIVAFAAVAEILSHVYRWELQQRQRNTPPPTEP
jgi:flagellar biosynthesis protein